MKVKDILYLIKSLHIYDINSKTEFTKFSDLHNADKGSIIFIDKSKKNKEEIARNTKASVIICDETITLPEPNGRCYIVTKEPKKDFLRVIKYFNSSSETGVSSDSIIFRDYVEIGKNVTIRAGSIIGGEGFGYEWLDGELINWPHIGKVIINDNVEIKYNSCIDRGTLSDTIIGKGVKIGNLVHISHNVIIGENTMVVCKSTISGSVKIGKECFIGIGATIRDKVTIGDGAFIGMGSVVTKNVEAGATVYGNPAKEVKK